MHKLTYIYYIFYSTILMYSEIYGRYSVILLTKPILVIGKL